MKAFIWVYSIHKLTFQILSPFFCWLFFSFEVSFLISEQKFIADLCTNSLLKSFEIFSPHYPFSSLVYHKNILMFLSNRLFFHSFKTSNWTKLLGSERNEPVFRKRQKVSNKHAGSDSTEITRFPCKAPITDIPGRPHTTIMYLPLELLAWTYCHFHVTTRKLGPCELFAILITDVSLPCSYMSIKESITKH